MVNSCCVVGCSNCVGKTPGLSFYRFPLSDGERCAKWVAALRRSGWTPTVHTRICSDHFVNGESYMNEINCKVFNAFLHL